MSNAEHIEASESGQQNTINGIGIGLDAPRTFHVARREQTGILLCRGIPPRNLGETLLLDALVHNPEPERHATTIH